MGGRETGRRDDLVQSRGSSTDIQNRLVVAKGEVAGGGIDWKFVISRLLRIEWKNNKVTLYNIGNYIQYPVINHNGKRMCIYV